MGIMDKAKGALKGKSDKVAKAVDGAGEQVNKRTKGKYADKISKGSERLKRKAQELDTEHQGTGTGGAPTSPPPSSPPPGAGRSSTTGPSPSSGTTSAPSTPPPSPPTGGTGEPGGSPGTDVRP